ncbi:uncharacterized protein LACBIDRAFT_325779 [Laccaria bicolor S238N-H82]|uniref:DNA 3'-5' helicase n=1 Tax=Laccaria bicolor (strain S238N-H82 / ATCC MYA-4686) TaxID=486041 RepID=B0D666_LACBS|nr:uncharacterized protein LACBIDRAFT_325779 [Laccaria bicolor S238N-H82]EDR09889.1 predicted protein [Laccaria bicolor S238N-H82]|eukprot:XP_001879274.1 predicted protein [Laccaria bicolor S238N-H82]
MPDLPHQQQSKNKKARRAQVTSKAWSGLRARDLEGPGLEQKIREKFKWAHSPCEFQLEAIKAQLLHKDVLIHTGTGSGKTTIAAGPHAVIEKSKGMITFMVSPLLALQEEQVLTFRNEFGLMATAVNSIHGGCTSEVMTRICKGEWQIVLISPEIILSKPFIKDVLRNPAKVPRILSIVVDEAHVVSHWGAGFRKQYAELGILHAILPKGTPFVAMSATLAPQVWHNVLKKLQIDERNYINIDIGNDQPNVSIVVRAIQNPMNTFSDLDFVIPSDVKAAGNIPKTFIYADQISAEVGMETRLTEHLPPKLRDIGLIRPFKLFKAGVIRVLICTDAAGMGCNIPDVDVVVQWKLPASVSTFVQQAGRAGRDPKRTGLAALLVEKSVYEADLTKLDEALSGHKKKSVRQSSTYPKAPKGYAIRHNVQRGSFGGLSNENVWKEDVPLDTKSLDKGLYSLAQTGSCRRKVLTVIYGNDTPYLTVPCCDLCDPTLLDRTRLAPSTIQPKAAALKMGIVNETVRSALQQWRSEILKRDFKDALFAPSGILSDERIDNLSSVGSIGRLNELERVVGADWPWFGQYGDALLEELLKLDIPPMQPKQQQKKPEKRTVQELEGQREPQGQPATKKKRGQKQAAVTPARKSTPTTVNPSNPSPSHVATPGPSVPASTPQSYNYSTPRHYATPQRPTYNPYSFMYTMRPLPPFYGYLHSPTQAPIHTPHPLSNAASRNPNMPSSSTTGTQDVGHT